MSTTSSPINNATDIVLPDRVYAGMPKETRDEIKKNMNTEKEAAKEAAKAEKEAAKAAKEAAKAEKEAAKVEKEAAKAEKEAAKAEKDAAKQAANEEKLRIKQDKLAAKEEKLRIKQDKLVITSTNDDILPPNDDILPHAKTPIDQTLLPNFDANLISNQTIHKKFHNFAAFLLYIRHTLSLSNQFDMQAFDKACNPFDLSLFNNFHLSSFLKLYLSSLHLHPIHNDNVANIVSAATANNLLLIDVKLHIIQGNKFLIDKTNVVYDFNTHAPIGQYNTLTKEVVYEKEE